MRWNQWVLPALLVLAWTVTWIRQRGVPLRFAGTALGVTLLTFPIGAVLISAADEPEGCAEAVDCLTFGAGLTWWFNGLYALPTLGFLSLLSLAVLAVREGREQQGQDA